MTGRATRAAAQAKAYRRALPAPLFFLPNPQVSLTPFEEQSMRAVHLSILIVLTAGCIGPASDEAKPQDTDDLPWEKTNDVVMQGNEFRPSRIEVTAGTVVTFENRDEVHHTVSDGDQTLSTPPGRSSQRSFNEPGTVGLLCPTHSGMTMQVRVLAT